MHINAQPSRPKKTWWKQPLTWVGGILSAVIIAVVVNFVTEVGEPIIHDALVSCPSGSPFKASVYHESNIAGNGFGFMAFPSELLLSRSALNQLPGSVDHRVQGYDGSTTSADLTLTAYCRVRILQMRADVVARHRPLDGTVIDIPSQGAVNSTGIYFNLDRLDPVALKATGFTGGSRPYFQDRTFEFAPKEQDSFKLEGSTSSYAIQWKVQITYLEGNETRVTYIQDGAEPFQTTALAIKDHYRAEYFLCFTGDELPGCDNRSGWQRIRPVASLGAAHS